MENATQFYGRTVASATLADDTLTLAFTDGSAVALRDDGQSCCEHRYVTCDDDLAALAGGTLTRIEERSAPDIDDENKTHECAFVEVATDRAFVTLTTHNEHNGYYGGFRLTLTPS